MSATTAPPLVGRDAPLTELLNELSVAIGGRGGFALVSGDAGLGKTRVAEEVADRARGMGLAVAWGSCGEGSGAPAYWPWAQVLRQLVAVHGSAVHAELGEVYDDLSPLLDPANANLPDDIGPAQFRLFDAATRAIAAASAEQPLLMVVDDLHWADTSSQRFTQHLAPLLRDQRTLLLATYRRDESDALLPDLLRLGRGVPLAGLTPDEVAALVTAWTGSSPDSTTARKLTERTGGNPFFVREVVRLLGPNSMGPLPATVRDVLDRRLARLPQDTHSLLAAAAVAGVDAPLDLITLVTNTAPPAVLDLLDPAVRAGLVEVVAPGRCRFVHALVRDALYDGLPASRRAALHAAYATAAESRARDAAVIAYHWICAGPAGDLDRAAAAAERAGDAAMAGLGYDEAAGHYADALSAVELLPVDTEQQGRLLLARGDALLCAGDLPKARAAYDTAAALARASDNTQLLARAALGFASGLGGFEIRLGDQHQLDLLDEALKRCAENDPLRPWLLARSSVALSFVASAEERHHLAEQAIEGARRNNDAHALAHALAAHCDACSGPDHVSLRLVESAEVIAAAGDVGDREQELLGRRLRVVALLETGDYPAAYAEMDAYARLAETLRQPMYFWYVALWRGLRRLNDGQLDQVEDCISEATRIGAIAHSNNAAALAVVQRGALDRAHGDYAAVLDGGQQLLAMLPDSIPARFYLAVVGSRVRPAEAARSVLDSVVPDGLPLPIDAEWLTALAFTMETAAVTGHAAAAEYLLDLARPYLHLHAIDGIGAASYGSMRRFAGWCAAALGRGDDAAALLMQAAADNAAAPYLAEAVRHDLARLAAGQPPWPPTEPGSLSAIAEGRNVGTWRRDGDVWTLSWAGRSVPMRDAKGLRDLAALLHRPGAAMHVLELVAAAEGTTGDRVDPGAGLEVLDRQAVSAYRQRLRDLEDDLATATADNDLARVDAVSNEREFLVAELSAALGLGGRARTTGDPTERARKAVAARVRDSIKRIAAQHPELGRHLEHAVRTGTFCIYEPEHPTTWQTSP